MSLGDSFDKSDRSNLYKQSLNVGDILKKEFKGITTLNFFIIVGISKDRVSLCSVYINSQIHPSIMHKQQLLNLQIPLKKKNNAFLKYDSFANCSTQLYMDIESISESIADKSCKVIDVIFKKDLEMIRKVIVNSGLLSEDEI